MNRYSGRPSPYYKESHVKLQNWIRKWTEEVRFSFPKSVSDVSRHIHSPEIRLTPDRMWQANPMNGKQPGKSRTMSTRSVLETASSSQSRLETESQKNGRIIPSLLASRPENGMVSMILFFGMSFFVGLLVYPVFLLDWYISDLVQCRLSDVDSDQGCRCAAFEAIRFAATSE